MKHFMCKLIGDAVNAHADVIADILAEASEAAGAHVLQKGVQPFEPQGATVFVVLSESHASYHSWPEHGFALLDYFSCAPDPKIEVFQGVIRKHFQIEEPVVVLR